MRIPFYCLTVSAACVKAAPEPAWPGPVIRVEHRIAATAATEITNAICIAPGVLATITDKAPGTTDGWRAASAGGTTRLQFLARDADSGFSLLARDGESDPGWIVIAPPDRAPALFAGVSLTLQSAVPAPARVAGRDHLHEGRLLKTPWLRVNLPAGTWSAGTPLTTESGALAGLLAAGVPGMPDAARMLPASAVWHFAGLWTRRKTLARAELGVRLNHADGIPRVQQCYAALPAERAGIHPGDIVLSIGGTEVADAAAAATACFYLRVDEPVKITLLRGLETVETTVTPISAVRQGQGQGK